MTDLKLVVWNVEWMNDLFVPNRQTAAFKPDDDEPAHSPGATVKQRREDLAGVLQELAPDLVVVVEGPNRPEELQLVEDCRRQSQENSGPSHTDQTQLFRYLFDNGRNQGHSTNRLRRHQRRPWPGCQRKAFVWQRSGTPNGQCMETRNLPKQRVI